MHHPPPCCQNSSHIMETVEARLASCQLGYGTPQGAEAAVHAAHLFLYNLQPSEVILKLDFKNAFHTIWCDKMLNAIESLVPELTHFVHSVYGEPSTPFWGQQTLSSREGVEQGDPLGDLVFCLTIHELCTGLESDLRLLSLDLAESREVGSDQHRSCRQRTSADCSPKSECDQARLCIPLEFPPG